MRSKIKKLNLKVSLLIMVLICVFILLIESGEYGASLFFAIPITIGFLLGYKNKYDDPNTSKRKKISKGLLTILLFVAILAFILIAVGIEGAICILMAYPFIIIPMYVAYIIGLYIGEADAKDDKINSNAFVLLFLLNPVTYIYDHYTDPIHDEVTSTLIIEKPREVIWEILTTEIEFNNKPNFFFKSGVSYPKAIKLNNEREQLSYQCYTNNDTLQLFFLEFKHLKKIKFAPAKQTIPMRELTPYDSINAKHLHNYLFVNYGEITLESIDQGKTRITAKTQYNYKIAPKWYWKLWSNYIIDEMQLHVLKSIKNNNHE